MRTDSLSLDQAPPLAIPLSFFLAAPLGTSQPPDDRGPTTERQRRDCGQGTASVQGGSSRLGAMGLDGMARTVC